MVGARKGEGLTWKDPLMLAGVKAAL
jgi:hypothetical protein